MLFSFESFIQGSEAVFVKMYCIPKIQKPLKLVQAFSQLVCESNSSDSIWRQTQLCELYLLKTEGEEFVGVNNSAAKQPSLPLMGLLLIGTRREHVVFWGIVSARRCGIGLRLHVSCRCWPKGPPPTSDAPPLTFACVIASRWRTSWVSLSAPFCPALLVLDRVPVNLLLSLHELCSKYVEKNWRGKHIAVDKF